MSYYKLIFFFFCLSYLSAFSQTQDIVQVVDIEQYRGKEFLLEGKIFYKDNITDNSYALLSSVSIDANGKPIKMPLFNDNAKVYHKENDWSHYELTGKVDKKAKYLAIGASIDGNGSYYFDDFKLYVKDGRNGKVEIPLKNAGFEKDSLTDWHLANINKNTRVSISLDNAASGKKSLFIDNSGVKDTPSFGNNPQVGKYMDVNGVKLYYEIYGKGEPLLFLNGNNSSMWRFSNQFQYFKDKYKIVGLDSRGQGKSTADSTKLTYELMAEDVNTFLDKLHLKKVNILGWSDGGNIALILAMNHPDKVNKMAIMGTVLYNNDASVTAETNQLLRKQVKEMEARGVAKTSMDYRLKMLLLTEPHINPDSLQKIQAPTLVMAGQYDVVKRKHTELIAKKIPKSQLIIFKGADHEAPEKIPDLFNKAVSTFFETK